MKVKVICKSINRRLIYLEAVTATTHVIGQIFFKLSTLYFLPRNLFLFSESESGLQNGKKIKININRQCKLLWYLAVTAATHLIFVKVICCESESGL